MASATTRSSTPVPQVHSVTTQTAVRITSGHASVKTAVATARNVPRQNLPPPSTAPATQSRTHTGVVLLARRARTTLAALQVHGHGTATAQMAAPTLHVRNQPLRQALRPAPSPQVPQRLHPVIQQRFPGRQAQTLLLS